MSKRFLTSAILLILPLCGVAQPARFLPGHIAVLRAGDGVFDLRLRQSPVFLDQYDPANAGSGPSFTVAIPTNGPNSFFLNGHAGSEGDLTRSVDRKLLAFAGYGGVALLQQTGTASRLNIRRGCTTVDGVGTIHTCLYAPDPEEVKINPRSVVTDGTNNFWGAGNANGTFFFNPTGGEEPTRFAAMPNSRAVRIFNGSLFATLNATDAGAAPKPLDPGVFVFSGTGLPRQSDVAIELFLPTESRFKKVVAFEMNPAGTIAYTTDIDAGVQKYQRIKGKWSFAYNIAIPQNIPRADNTATGCFGLAVDFAKSSPVIYATTTEGYGGSVNSNRIVRIVDTGSAAAVTTFVQAANTNIVFRGIALTPE
jgi:hypothetical protein